MRLVETLDNPIPPGARMSAVQTPDGMTLRCARFMPSIACRGTFLIASGRSEFIEKYFETIGELLTRGFCVVVFDWRGQGLSTRELDDGAKGHIGDFSFYQRDLDAVIKQVLEPHCPAPWFALGHSMGGAILLAHARAKTSPFERLVLVAPMIGLNGLRSLKVASAIAALLENMRLGQAFVPGSSHKPLLSGRFEGNPLTSDERRFDMLRHLLAVEPRLGIGGPTIAWANAALRFMQSFQGPDFTRRIDMPILIFAPREDRLVDPCAIACFAKRLKRGRFILLDESRHEILIEQDRIRARFWLEFDAFIPTSVTELMSERGAR